MLGFHLINISFTLCSDEPDNKQFVKMSRKSCLNKPHSIKKKTELEDHVDIGSCSDVFYLKCYPFDDSGHILHPVQRLPWKPI